MRTSRRTCSCCACGSDVPPLFSTQRLFPRLPELRRLHPRLHIDIDTAPHLIDRVGDTLDAAVLLTTRPEPGLHAVQLDHNRVHAICSRELADQLGPNPGIETLEKQTFLIHSDLPQSFDAWKAAIGMPRLQPAAVDHFDSGPLILEAAAQGLGIAMMHDDHLKRARDPRLAQAVRYRGAEPLQLLVRVPPDGPAEPPGADLP